jgi:ribonuclease D
VASVHISKEDINSLPIGRWEGPSRLVRTAEEVSGAVRTLSRASLLGFDTETRPAFRKGQKFSPSLLQLATDDEVFLFQLKHTGLPETLVTILSNPAIIKAGVAPDFDLLSLQDLQPFHPRGFTDLAEIARLNGIKNQGLRGLAAIVCGIRISKSARTTNWASNDLTLQQIQYAATDAWIGREIYRLLKTRTVQPTP